MNEGKEQASNDQLQALRLNMHISPYEGHEQILSSPTDVYLYPQHGRTNQLWNVVNVLLSNDGTSTDF